MESRRSISSADVVVVGAGAAGCAAAARLAAGSAGSGRPVLVLEAGPGGSWPGALARRSLDGPVEPYRQGRGIGGSTAIFGGLLEVPDDADTARLGWPALGAVARSLLPQLSNGVAEWGAFDRAIAAAGVAVLPGSVAEATTLARGDASSLLAGRPEVTVRTDATVDCVVFDRWRARGVRLVGGEVVEASAVVLAAGALATPAILLRSGVSGVGTGLVDHVGVALKLSPHPAASEAVRTSVLVRSRDVALVPLATGEVFGIRLATVGRGFVRLASPDPAVPPEVVFDLLGDERDRAGLRAVARTLVALARHPAVMALGDAATLGADATPLDIADGDDVTLDAWLVDHLADVFHAAGTCSAAVDRSGRLLGAEGCWVVDASVLPDLPRCAPALTVSALAHHLASAIP